MTLIGLNTKDRPVEETIQSVDIKMLIGTSHAKADRSMGIKHVQL